MRRSANCVALVSERFVKVLMIPLFSATKTRPLGANSTAMGSVRPVKAVDSWKPAGSVAALRLRRR